MSSKKIINKIALSKLITLDLDDYFPKEEILLFDLKDLLFQETILKEKEFRSKLKEIDLSIYTNKIVALNCSSNAIVPMWAYMLVVTYLRAYCENVFFGNKETATELLFLKNIKNINLNLFKNKKVLVKGCGNFKLTESIYVAVSKKLHDSVDSLMFGEACSSVPVYKRK